MMEYVRFCLVLVAHYDKKCLVACINEKQAAQS